MLTPKKDNMEPDIAMDHKRTAAKVDLVQPLSQPPIKIMTSLVNKTKQ